jgi:hypothetical protein
MRYIKVDLSDDEYELLSLYKGNGKTWKQWILEKVQ